MKLRTAWLLALFSIVASVQADNTWTLTTADFRTQAVLVNSIDSNGVHILASPGKTESTVSFDNFLDVSRPVASSMNGGKFLLHLSGEDQIGGEPVSIKGNDLIWNNPALGDIAIPMKQLVAMTKPAGPLPDAHRREDVVTLANGDSLHGIIGNFAAGKVTVQTDAGASEVPISSVVQINFATAVTAPITGRGFRVRFDDGSSIVASAITFSADKAELSFATQSAHAVDPLRIAAIEQVNGPVSWLSSRTPVENIYVPFMGSMKTGSAKMDRNWNGADLIRFGPRVFAHGIGAHSYSRLTWNLDSSYAAFRTQYAIDSKDANAKADVVVRVLLDGKSVYEQTHVRAGTLSPVIALDVKGAKQLTLEVDYGDNLDTQDRLNWIEPALLKQAVR